MGWLKKIYMITIVQVQNSSLKFEYETQVSEILCIKIFINKLFVGFRISDRFIIIEKKTREHANFTSIEFINRSREFGTHEKIRKKFAKIHD